MILLVGALAGCAGAEAMTLPPQPAAPTAGSAEPAHELGLIPGESMAFDVHLGGVLGGEAQLAVGEIGELDGHRAIVVKSRAATAGAVKLLKNFVDEATTTIDADTGRPLLLDTSVDDERQDDDGEREVHRLGRERHVHQDRRPEAAHLSRRLRQGHRSRLALGDGPDARLARRRGLDEAGLRRRRAPDVAHRHDVRRQRDRRVGARQSQDRAPPGAAFRAKPNLQIEAGNATRTFDVWISDDADRVPIKMTAHTELGDVAMDLTEYNRP